MSKTAVNSLITKMKKAGIVTKVSPWMHENGEDTRYVGLRFAEWDELISKENNFLAKFGNSDRRSFMTIFLANKAPFILLSKKEITKESKWELILGSLRQRINHDKQEYLSGTSDVQNMYEKMLSQLKK